MTSVPAPHDADIGSLLRHGDLAGAQTAAAVRVKAAPNDSAARLLLAELCLFDGELERADSLVSTMATLDTGATLVAAEFRQLLRAELQRRAVFDDGALPEFVGEPTPAQKESLRALVALRAGDTAEAQQAVDEAEKLRPRVPGKHCQQNQEHAFDDMRDADDILCGTLEVLTTTGKYFWIPLESVVELTFHAPHRPRDLFWRRATIIVREGPEGDVYVPALYYPTGDSTPLRLGRATEWSETSPVRGLGQRVFLTGEEVFDILQGETLLFA